MHCEVTNSSFQTGAVALPSGLFAGRLSSHLTDVGCNGSEPSLLSCSITLSEQCMSNEDAAVVCQGRVYHYIYFYYQFASEPRQPLTIVFRLYV